MKNRQVCVCVGVENRENAGSTLGKSAKGFPGACDCAAGSEAFEVVFLCFVVVGSVFCLFRDGM